MVMFSKRALKLSIDQKTIEFAVQQYYSEIYRFCFSRMINKNDVEDVVQNVFVVLQEKGDDLTSENLRAWLFSVAQRKLLEERRDEIRRSRFVSYDVEVIAKDPLLTYEIVEEHISENDVCALKARILQMLTPEERDLFEQIYEKHVNRKEVAKKLSITENALNVRVHRLRNHIKSLTKTVTMLLIFVYIKCR